MASAVVLRVAPRVEDDEDDQRGPTHSIGLEGLANIITRVNAKMGMAPDDDVIDVTATDIS